MQDLACRVNRIELAEEPRAVAAPNRPLNADENALLCILRNQPEAVDKTNDRRLLEAHLKLPDSKPRFFYALLKLEGLVVMHIPTGSKCPVWKAVSHG